MSFKSVTKFEKIVAKFFNAPFGIATDSCTHAIELCFRYKKIKNTKFPINTYVSIPMLGNKLNLNWTWKHDKWKNFYYFEKTNIIDAAVYWKEFGYIPNTLMCLSFQYQKHINIGKGGMILTDNFNAYNDLIKMAHDGRERNTPWRMQNISCLGYHYYLMPELAEEGIKIFKKKKNLPPKIWSFKDYPNLKNFKCFR